MGDDEEKKDDGVGIKTISSNNDYDDKRTSIGEHEDSFDDDIVPTEIGAEVPTYGKLRTTVQTPSPVGGPIAETFEGTQVDLEKSPYLVNNDLFEGQVHTMFRDVPGNNHDFNGDEEVLWEIQIQVSIVSFSAS